MAPGWCGGENQAVSSPSDDVQARQAITVWPAARASREQAQGTSAVTIMPGTRPWPRGHSPGGGIAAVTGV